MATSLLVPVSPAAMLAAVACVVAGGPWFADGLRSWRARRWLLALPAEPATALAAGAGAARGAVVLESPLFTPLSARPCAGFELELIGDDHAVAGRVRESRAFRLATESGLALVADEHARWELAVTAERAYDSAADLSENLRALFARAPETRWQLSRPGRVLVRERALFAGHEACVIGEVQRLEDADAGAADVERLRTGTDGAWTVAAAPTEHEPAWRIEPAEALERCIVCDAPREPRSFAPPAWRAGGALLGPALSLAGLLVLVHAVGRSAEGRY